MNFKIGVEIDNNRIVWILDSNHQQKAMVRLTTVADNQTHAVIKLYIKSANKKHLVFTKNVTNIPKQPAGIPSINVTVSTSGKNLSYNFNLNEKTISRDTRNIGKYTRSYKPLIIAAIVAALCVAVILIFAIITQSPTPRLADDKTQSVSTREDTNINTPDKTPEVQVERQLTQIEPAETKVPETTTPETTTPETTTPVTNVPETKTPEIKNLPAEPAFIESEITDRHSVYFEPDSSVLTKDAISGLGSFIERLPEENDFNEGSFEVEVRGHCARYGTEEGRAELSRERAIMVYNFLKTEWKLEADSVISGAGSSEPVTLKKDEQYLNRRVDLNIKGNIKKIKTTY